MNIEVQRSKGFHTAVTEGYTCSVYSRTSYNIIIPFERALCPGLIEPACNNLWKNQQEHYDTALKTRLTDLPVDHYTE